MARTASERTGPLTLPARLAQLWDLQGLPSDKITLTLHRAWMLSFPLGAVALVIVAVAIVAWIASHRTLIPGRAVCLLVVVALMPTILRHTTRLTSVVRQGYCTRRGVPVRRSEQPQRYWSWTAVEALVLGVQVAAASYLLLFGLARG